MLKHFEEGKTMSSNIKRVGDLEINEDLVFQKRSWTVQRIGWVIMALVLAAALLGLFGAGPLSRATAGTEDEALWVEYDRFSRLLKTTDLKVHATSESGEVRLWISREYLEKVEISHITPTEDSAEAAQDGVFYVFQSAEPLTIVIHLRAAQAGLISGEMRLDGGPSQEFTQFIYP
jgi:hypothetical protein